MPNRSDAARKSKEEMREKILGFGEHSIRKSYYPALLDRSMELERFKALLDEARDAVGLLEIPSLRFVDLNRSGKLLLGVSPDEPLPVLTNLLDDAAGTAIAQWLKKIGAGVREGLSFSTALPQENDGQETVMELSLSYCRFSDRDYGVAILRDITGLKRAEQALRQSESKLKSIISSAPVGIGVVRHRTFLEANEFLCNMTGYTREELIGQTSRLFYRTEREFRWVGEELYSKILSGGITTSELCWRRKDGAIIDVLLSLTPADASDPGGPITFTVLDITQRKQAEKALVASEENLSITLDSIGDAVIATDRHGIITRINPVAAQLTGWKINEAVGQQLEKVFRIYGADSGQSVASPVQRVIATGEVIGLANHTTLISRDGSEYQIADSGAPIRNTQGNIVGVVLVFRDVTQQYELEEQLRQAEKMDSIGKLAGGIAHDFNNMLTGIMASADLLGRRIDQNNPRMKSLITIIKDSCHKAADLTQKLLAFARKARMVSHPVDVHSAIDSAVELLERSIDRRIEIVRKYRATISRVNGDPSQLTNVFLNLGVNSRDAMPEGGVILVETDNVTLDQPLILRTGESLNPGNYLHVRFTDSGCGIAEEYLGKIFEPFFTTKEVGKGSGLGLSAVYGAVREHGGGIKVESMIGNGTSFDLYFPGLIEQEPEKPLADESAEVVCGKGRIMVVDDEDLVRFTAREILEDAGFEVMVASDGAEALEQYRRNQDQIDLVILDMIMPRMNGRECFVEMQRINPEVKVMISTGFVCDQNLSEHFPPGIAGFIRKPFTINELLNEIAKNIPG